MEDNQDNKQSPAKDFPEERYRASLASIFNSIQSDGIEESVKLAKNMDLLVQEILKLKEFYIEGPSGRLRIGIKEIRDSNLANLEDTAKSLSEIAGHFKSEKDATAFHDKYYKLLFYLVLDDFDLKGLPQVYSYREGFKARIDSIEKKQNGKARTLEAYKAIKKAEGEAKREKEDLDAHVKKYERILCDFVPFYLESHAMLSGITRAIHTKFAAAKEEGYETEVEAALDFLEALYLPFEVMENASYENKQSYWGAVKRLLDDKKATAEQINEFACFVKDELAEGKKIDESVHLAFEKLESKYKTVCTLEMQNPFEGGKTCS